MNRQARVVAHPLILVIGLLGVQSACGPTPRGEIRNKIVDSMYRGEADDADPSQPPQEYYGQPALVASDGSTYAESAPVQHDFVAGAVTAVSPNPALPTFTDDFAFAVSSSSVTSEFVVHQAGRFAFNIALNVKGITIIHDGTAVLTTSAVLSDAAGRPLTDAQGQPLNPPPGLGGYQLEFNSNHEVIIDGDTANPDYWTLLGGYSRNISGPNRGVPLDPGTYRLELSLTVTATAPIGTGPDGRLHEAEVLHAEAVIETLP